VLKALVEVAGLALLGQGTLYLLAGASREAECFLSHTEDADDAGVARQCASSRRVLSLIDTSAICVPAAGAGLVFTGRLPGPGSAWTNSGIRAANGLRDEYVKRCGAGSTQACDVLRRQATTPGPARP